MDAAERSDLPSHLHLPIAPAGGPPRTMPSQSILTKEEKDKVKAAVPSSSFKVQTAALARIYYAYPNPKEWSYTGLQGAIAFVHDSSRNAPYFRMVDLDGTRGITWEHECYDGFELFQDRPYFHSFAGDVSVSSTCCHHVYLITFPPRTGMHDRAGIC